MEKMSSRARFVRYVLLFIAAVIWGLAFAVQCEAMEAIKPFTFTALRAVLGSLVLVPVFLIVDSVKKKKNPTATKMSKTDKKNLLLGGVSCGVCVAVASNLQQFGIAYTMNPGKAGFVTAMYIVLVPIVGLFFKKKSHWIIWLSVAIAVCGLYFICVSETMTIEKGDLLLIASAACFTGHILIIDHFADKADGIKMSCIQFAVSAVLSGIAALIFERDAFSLAAVLSAYPAILYAGIGSCGVAFTLQIIGQKGTNPTVASLVMSMESCFSVVGGILLMHAVPTVREGIGCGLMFTAIILSQIKDLLPTKKSRT